MKEQALKRLELEHQQMRELLRFIQGLTTETTTCSRCSHINNLIKNRLGTVAKILELELERDDYCNG